nr:YuiB family protein [Cohnella faecalis]
MLEILQEIVGALLFFVFAFGIGFILNMLVKTTWFPLWAFVIVVLPLGAWHFWDPDTTAGSFIAVFLPPMLAIVGGAYVSGWAIRKLRLGGYKMF